MRRHLAAALAAAALAAAGCGGGEESRTPALVERLELEPSGVRVLLVGIDGASPGVVDAMLEAGELPNLRRLIEAGAYGVLRSEPPMKSPALWTTLATGRPRDEHGITGFTVANPAGKGRLLVSSNQRRALNLWDILGAGGRSVGVAGWWVTWPAEPVRGWMVSDRMTRSRWSEWSDGAKSEHLTFPPELAAELKPLVVDPADPPLEVLRSIVPMSPGEEQEMLAARRPVFGHGPSVVKFALSNQLTYERIALDLLERGQPDFTALFLIAADPVSHTYWHHHEPRAFEFGSRPVDASKAEVVRNIYRHNDAYLGRLLEAVGEDTVVVVASDHGFRAARRLPQEKPAGQFADAFYDGFEEVQGEGGEVTVGQSGTHDPDGLLIVSGPPIVAGRIEPAALADVVPTLLALYGFPVPEDLEGRVLTEILRPEHLAAHPLRRIRSYEPLVDRDALRVDPDVSANDPARLEMLRSLGYIQ